MKLNLKQLNKIRDLTEEGMSLNQISNNVNVSKTTVYYHFKKIRGLTNIKPKFNFNDDTLLGEVVGIFTGDGSFYFEPKGYHYQIRVHFGIKNIKYLNKVKKLFDFSFGKSFSTKKDGDNKLILETHSKDISHFFFEYLNFNGLKIKHGVCSPRKRGIYHIYIFTRDNNRIKEILKPFKGR